MVQILNWRTATAGGRDVAGILELMRAFYAEEHLVFEEVGARKAVVDLVEKPEAGRVFFLEAGEGGVAGYVVLTFGWSLEFHGRFVLLDEIYLKRELRGRGLGQRVLADVEAWAKAEGAATVRLEVNDANTGARRFYERAGFKDGVRDVRTKWL